MKQYIVWLVPVIHKNIYGKAYLDTTYNLYPNVRDAHDRMLELFGEEQLLLHKLADVNPVKPIAIQYSEWDENTEFVPLVENLISRIVEVLESPRPDRVTADEDEEHMESTVWLSWEIPTAIPDLMHRSDEIRRIADYLVSVAPSYLPNADISYDDYQVHVEIRPRDPYLPLIHVGISPMNKEMFDPKVRRSLMNIISQTFSEGDEHAIEEEEDRPS